MGGAVEITIVAVVVAAAVFWALRALVRTVRKTGGCSSCATSGECPLAGDGENLVELGDGSADLPRQEARSR